MFKLNRRFHSFYSLMPTPVRDLLASGYSVWSGRTKYGGVFSEWQKFLEESQWWDSERLRAYQEARLGELFELVSRECPFYRQLIEKNGIEFRQKGAFAALERFPIIEKAVVRQHYHDIKSSYASDKRLILTTSGTTGASLHVPHTKEAIQREYAFRWQFYAVAGAKRRDRFAFFQGHMVVPETRKNPPFHIRNRSENSLFFSLYHMSEQNLPAYVDALKDFEPRFLYGYPSGIFILAAFINKKGWRLPAPLAVFTASEMLHDFQRLEIERAFGAPVFQWYGQVETTVNLHECNHHRFHVKEEYGLLELLNDDGTKSRPGEVANAIVTGWGNKAFPLIRYRTGDNMVLAEDQRCPCGRGGRIIERIVGRDDDFIVTPDGKYVGRLDFVFKPVDTVKESQIIQDDEKNITVRVVPAVGFSERDEQVIIEKLRERLGKSMDIRIEKLERIPRLANGKFRYVISKVNNPFVKHRPAPTSTISE